jgi:hypothetical protein
LVPAADAAALLGITLREFSNLDRRAWLPRALRIGRAKLWRVNELADWYEVGCPSRDEWESDEHGQRQLFPGLGWNRPYDGNWVRPREPAQVKLEAGPYIATPLPQPRPPNWWRWREQG